MPLYRQLFEEIRDAIDSGQLGDGDRLPATRELARKIGLNRTTVTAAYELLEAEGLIESHVGRGSFVAGGRSGATTPVRWSDLLTDEEWPEPPLPDLGNRADLISFATSRPSSELFPLEEIRKTTREVVEQRTAEILQLGSPAGYPPLRSYLTELTSGSGEAGPADDVIITNGCQQALDLLGRVLIKPGDTVAVEDPLYPGVHHALTHAGASITGVPVGPDGIDIERLGDVLREQRPKLLMVTPNFQNPTGATLTLESRKAILDLARECGTVIAENDIYAELRYEGEDLPSLKRMDSAGLVIQLRSFSKVAFPGLRVGWVLGPRPVVERLTEAKQWSDLHTDHLSQAVLWRFAEAGRLDAHRRRVVAGGRARLAAALGACAKHLPDGARYTRPQGGMNLWVELPDPLDAGELLPRAIDQGVVYLPGRYFAVARPRHGALRLSFAGLDPDRIKKGIAVLGALFEEELQRRQVSSRRAPAPAMV